jgi:hypothetical protein
MMINLLYDVHYLQYTTIAQRAMCKFVCSCSVSPFYSCKLATAALTVRC